MADLELYGHPFRGIWQSLADDLGITTARMRQNILDQQAEQVSQLHNANIALADAMQGGDAEQNATAGQEMRDLAQIAAQNIAALARGQAPQPLPSGAALAAPFYQEREQGRIASTIDMQNKLYDLAKQRRDEFHNEITKTQDLAASKYAEIDSLIDLANKLGDNSDIVQSKARDLAGMSLGDAKAEGSDYGSVGVHGLAHLDLASLLGVEKQDKLGYDSIIKLAASTRAIVDKYTGAKIAALQQHALASGFTLDPATGGLMDVNVPDYGGNAIKPRAPNASDTLTSAPTLPQAVANTTLGGMIAAPAAAAGNVVGNLLYGGGRLGPTELDRDVAQRLSELTPEQRSALQILQQQQARRRARERSVRPVNP